MQVQEIFVTGASGLLGSEIINLSCGKILKRSLNDNSKIEDFISNEGSQLIHCAARVGGIKANSDFIADFYDDNVKLNMNVLHHCRKKKLKLVSILSTCIYPDSCYVKYPLTENQLHLGPPHSSNYGYAYSKRMLDIQSRAYRQQYGCNFITVIPNNLYGLNDNYDLEKGHVIPSLIRKFYEAKIKNEKAVIVWGTGRPLREFTFARDAAQIILWLAKNYNDPDPVNIGNTEQISIHDLSKMIASLMRFQGKIVFDSSMPDGQYEKPSCNDKLRKLGCNVSYTSLKDGLQETINYFEKVYPNVRGIKNKV